MRQYIHRSSYFMHEDCINANVKFTIYEKVSKCLEQLLECIDYVKGDEDKIRVFDDVLTSG
jgi:hypothetical protein